MKTIQQIWGIWEISSNKKANSISKVINKNNSTNKYKIKINDLSQEYDFVEADTRGSRV